MKILSTKFIRNALIIATPFFAQSCLAAQAALACHGFSDGGKLQGYYSVTSGSYGISNSGTSPTWVYCDADPQTSPVIASAPQPRTATLDTIDIQGGSIPYCLFGITDGVVTVTTAVPIKNMVQPLTISTSHKLLMAYSSPHRIAGIPLTGPIYGTKQFWLVV